MPCTHIDPSGADRECPCEDEFVEPEFAGDQRDYFPMSDRDEYLRLTTPEEQ